MKLRVDARALQDLRDIRAYITGQGSRSAANPFEGELYRIIHLI